MLAPCPTCDEVGCDECNGKGYFEVSRCPKEYVGHKISHAANLLSYVNKGLLPDSGGVLDQSAWMVTTWDAIESDCAKIEEERRRRS